MLETLKHSWERRKKKQQRDEDTSYKEREGKTFDKHRGTVKQA